MQDRTKGCLSGVFFALAFVLPVVILAIGWIGWDLKVGAVVALATFALFFILGGIFAIFVKAPSWFQVMLPFVAGVLYSVLNPFPLPFDDVPIACAGAILSYVLALKKYVDAPRWIIVPLIASALYTVVGEFVPGTVDELIVGMIAAGTSAIAAAKSPSAQALPPPKQEA